MDNQQMITRLKQAGIVFAPGMSETELNRAETVFQFRFPKEVRTFLSAGVPVGKSFFDYRDLSEENVSRFQSFQASVEKSFRFDLEHNREELLELLGEKLGFEQDSGGFDDAVMNYLHNSVRLIPFFAHRCFFDGMDDLPIVSFWQPTDSIFYGYSFMEYLEEEFLGIEFGRRLLPADFPRETGIWYELLMQ